MLREPGIHVASTSNEAVISGAVNLNDYDTVIWILGDESTADDTFNATEQAKVTSFINAGGNLFLSGSEIGWDLDQQNNGRTFYETTLKANYVNDDANTNTATAVAAGIFAGMSSFVFSTGSSFSQLDGQMYDVDYPDVIAPQAGAVSALTYSGGTGGTAAIQVAGTGGKGSIVMFGFPFETITSAARRQTAMGRILDFFVLAAPSPIVDIKTRVNGQDADVATGPILAAGSTAAFTYIITNPGNVPLSGLTVKDNNGTPGNPADDFNATYTSGDTNSNGQLDVGETWTYSASRTVVAGQYTTTGTVTATGNAQSISDTDAANYFGSAPGISVQSFIFGQDADVAPGLTLTAGDLATFTYVVTNTGNIPLGNVVVVDDNSTPGNTADDFNPAFSSGDTNGNGKLDLGETWIYSAVRTVVAGQHTHSGTATASDSIAQAVLSSDPTNYLGVAIENADFNGDGIVDSGDYVPWRKNNGLTSGATHSQGDANSDGMVDSTDYSIWRAQFGMSIESGGQSPGLGAAGEAALAANATDNAATIATVTAALSEAADISPGAVDSAFEFLSTSRRDSSRSLARRIIQHNASNRTGLTGRDRLLVESATRHHQDDDATDSDFNCTPPSSNLAGINEGNPSVFSGVSVAPLLKAIFGRLTP